MQEIWKDIKDYNGIYQVSNLGNVRSLDYRRKKEIRLLRQYKDKFGYLHLKILNDKRLNRVHRIVAEAFIPNPKNKRTINHKNGIKSDNRVENLEWNTYSENALHSFKFLGRQSHIKNKFGILHPNSKPVNQFDLSGNFIKYWDCIADIVRECGFQYCNISRTCRGERNKAHGFKWEFAEKQK